MSSSLAIFLDTIQFTFNLTLTLHKTCCFLHWFQQITCLATLTLRNTLSLAIHNFYQTVSTLCFPWGNWSPWHEKCYFQLPHPWQQEVTGSNCNCLGLSRAASFIHSREKNICFLICPAGLFEMGRKFGLAEIELRFEFSGKDNKVSIRFPTVVQRSWMEAVAKYWCERHLITMSNWSFSLLLLQTLDSKCENLLTLFEVVC